MEPKVNDEQKAELMGVLKAFIGEWGTDSVVVSVPRQWESRGFTSLGPVALVYAGDDSVMIGVEHSSARITYRMVLN